MRVPTSPCKDSWQRWLYRKGDVARERPRNGEHRLEGKHSQNKRGGGESFAQFDIWLCTCENTLLALPPIKRTVPMTITNITANITAYSATSCPRSSNKS